MVYSDPDLVARGNWGTFTVKAPEWCVCVFSQTSTRGLAVSEFSAAGYFWFAI